MSGHSKWSTIHRAKEVKDQARGKLFSKVARIITIAAKTGGGPNPEANFRLKDAIEKARAISMPKENIERAINKAAESGDLFEATYEGFGPAGVAIIIEAATDNKNRTIAEFKTLFEKRGGTLGGSGSVAYNFDHKGLIVLQKKADVDSQMLELIDEGAADIEDTGQVLHVYVEPSQTSQVKQRIIASGQTVLSSELIMKPKTFVEIEDEEMAQKIVDLLDALEEHDDVQKVFDNAKL
ncbi:MAG: YebC/PmpR family DNA-binding transcriptional regulator [Patescibacteria group bacterium]